jgi:rare lipoprotein A
MQATTTRVAGPLLTLLALAGCAAYDPVSDGPGRTLNPESIIDAVPQPEPVTRAGNYTPYTVFGKTYHLLPSADGYRESGIASWYGRKFHGRLTSNGEVYDMYQMTAAHKTLPIPSYVRVTNRNNGLSTIVRINDRGPFHDDRVIDLSWAAATKLGYQNDGTAEVDIAVIDPAEWRREQQSSAARPTPAAAELLSGDYLQAGAFAEPDLAHLLLLELIDQLPYAVQVHRDQQRYKVLVGPLVGAVNLNQARQRLAAASIAAFKVSHRGHCEVSNPELKC